MNRANSLEEGNQTSEGMDIILAESERLTNTKLELLKKIYDSEPYCSVCGKKLETGDRVDRYWPYFAQYNRCRKCLMVRR